MDITKVTKRNFLTLQYAEDLFARLDNLVAQERHFDALLIDLIATGFSLPLDSLSKLMVYGMKLLNEDGILLLIKSDGAMLLTKDNPSGGFNINVYDSPLGFAVRYPILADFARSSLSGLTSNHLEGLSTNLSQYILGTSMPVLTTKGKARKQEFSLDHSLNRVAQLIDDYTTVDAIIKVLELRHGLPPGETMRLLQELEGEQIIFPLFARVDFLSRCFQNKKPFRLGRYMVEANIISQAQLQSLLEKQRDETNLEAQHTLLGLMAVESGLINFRQLQTLLADQYLYGGYRSRDGENTAAHSQPDKIKDTMIGSLSAIDTPGLLQSLSSAQKTGLLTIEDRERIMHLQLLDGKPTHARMNKLGGFDALVEFITTWTDGIFVFRDKESLKNVDDTHRIKQNLSHILLDAALFHDHIEYIINCLPQGLNTTLERTRDFSALWDETFSSPLLFMDESPVTERDMQLLHKTAALIDGFSSVTEVIKSLEVYPTHKALKAILLLMEQNLIIIQKGSLFVPLNIFQKISQSVESLIGRDNNKVLLQASLHYVLGGSIIAQCFQVDQNGKISVNLNQMRMHGQSGSAALGDLRQWMEAYLAYCRKKVEPATIDALVSETVKLR